MVLRTTGAQTLTVSAAGLTAATASTTVSAAPQSKLLLAGLPASVTAGDGGLDDLSGLSATGRFVRIYGTKRATGYGYSLWEVELYGN